MKNANRNVLNTNNYLLCIQRILYQIYLYNTYMYVLYRIIGSTMPFFEMYYTNQDLFWANWKKHFN
jgi:hypothetical protein